MGFLGDRTAILSVTHKWIFRTIGGHFQPHGHILGLPDWEMESTRVSYGGWGGGGKTAWILPSYKTQHITLVILSVIAITYTYIYCIYIIIYILYIYIYIIYMQLHIHIYYIYVIAITYTYILYIYTHMYIKCVLSLCNSELHSDWVTVSCHSVSRHTLALCGQVISSC